MQIASSEAKMQRAMDQVSKSCDNDGLTISTKKTEFVHQRAPGKPYDEHHGKWTKSERC